VPVWPAASELTLPSNATTTPGAQDGNLVGVSCASQGNCAASGYYKDTSGGYQAMVVAETGGVWGQAGELSLPSNADTTAGAQDAYLGSVSCASQGNCAVSGDYTDTGGGQQAMVAAETGGVWGQASELSLPSNAKTIAGSQYAVLLSVSCASQGNCAAGGYYRDTSGSQQAMVAAEAGGVWGQASELSLPSNASATLQDAYVRSVSCTSQGNCVAGGRFKDTAGNRQAMVVAETNGSWGQASELSLPSNANAGSQLAAVQGVSCTSAGNCSAVGYYKDTSGGYQAMVAAEAGGVWGQAGELSLPADADTTAGAQDAGLGSVSCTSQDNCVADGDYKDTSGGSQAMVVAETGGVWGQASELSLPSNANTTAGAQFAGLGSVSCTSQGNCVAGGDYKDTSGAYRAMSAASVGSLSVSGSSLPSAVPDIPYHAHLSATGGAGNYSWSIVSGSLPAGLSLSSDGTISGTPTAAGNPSFTVQVSDPGPPAQRATQTLSIRVGQPPAVTTVTRIGDQKLTLTTPSPAACVAPSSGLAVQFNSTRTPTGAKLKFTGAAFYIDKGVKHKVHKRIGGRRRLVTLYLPNATKHHVPATLEMSLARLGAGVHTLNVIASYKKTVRKHGHLTTRAVTKTLRAKFNVC
jgi:hypothetical protein